MKVGFIGLGIMGRPMAHNLIKGGHELFVFGKRTVPPVGGSDDRAALSNVNRAGQVFQAESKSWGWEAIGQGMHRGEEADMRRGRSVT